MPNAIEEFKHCPFCGRIWMTINACPENLFAVHCRCGTNGPGKESETSAVEAWNTRDQHLLWNPFRFSVRFPKNRTSIGFRGNIESLDIASILQLLSSKSKTGVLQLSQEKIKSVICLKEGNIVAASDNTGQIKLGRILYANGMISEEKLQHALEAAKKSDKRLGEVLVSMKYIDKETLKDVIYHQVQKTVMELLFWKEGDFEYRDCVVEFDQDSVREINTMALLMESSRQMDEKNSKLAC
ncbi:DUF4388 domain-containing protein [Desulfococcaceae bacterium HSG8]|nr:DUF4388 domain-containing protein [Desulfococcaceae bacterium HSG8]